MVERYRVVLRGIRPLLMHRVALDETPGPTRAGGRPDPKVEAKHGLYRDKEGRIVVPALNIQASLRAAARRYRVPGRGRATFADYVLSGLSIEPEDVPLQIPDGRKPEDAWEIDVRPAVIQKARILRARPRFDQWGLEFFITIRDPSITEDTLSQILVEAGSSMGLMDFRPLFGLFEVDKMEKVP